MTAERSAASAKEEQADFVQAFQELAKGERTATALENQLATMEAKIEALLAEAEKRQQEVEQLKADRTSTDTANRESSERK